MRTLTPKELSEISRETLSHYSTGAASFWEGTRDHDVSQNIEALLRAIEAPPPSKILDLGCGPGRDLATFSSMGHSPVGLDGSQAFCEMAREHARCPVLHQDFLSLELPHAEFDGIFANASLFHVPTQELPRVLAALRDSLKKDGVLFSSNPRGNNSEGWNGQRFGAYHDLSTWRSFMKAAEFEEIEHYYRPQGLPRDQQPWLAGTWRAL